MSKKSGSIKASLIIPTSLALWPVAYSGIDCPCVPMWKINGPEKVDAGMQADNAET